MSDIKQRLRNLTTDEIAALARRLHAPSQTGRTAVSEVVVKPSGTQRRIWFAQQALPSSGALNNSVALDIQGPLDSGRLHAALVTVLSRHDILRATYTAEGAFGDVLPAPLALEFTVEDISLVAPSQREQLREAMLAESAAAPFDLERGPLVRALVVSSGAREHSVAVTVHHIAFDAWSRAILMTELEAAYLNPNANELPPPASAYSVYATQRALQKDAGEIARLEAYWQSVAEDLPASPLGCFKSTSGGHAQESRLLQMQLPAPLWSRVESMAKERRTTPFAVALAALNLTLHRLSGMRDIALITSFAAREEADSAGIVGPLLDTLLIRSRIEATTSGALIDEVSTSMRAAMAHRGLPFEDVVSLAGHSPEPGAHPLSRIALVLDAAPRATWNVPGLTARARNLHPGASSFDLFVLLEQGENSVCASLEYRVDIIGTEAAEAIGSAFVHILSTLARDAAIPVSTIKLVNDDGARQLITAAAGPPLLSPISVPDFGRAFVEVAQRQADAIALRIGTAEVSYGELLADASRLAHRLRAMGVAQGVLVAIALPRDRDFFTSMLGVTLAGATFLLIDVSLSGQVVSDMLMEAAPGVLLTRASIGSGLGVPPWTLCMELDRLPVISIPDACIPPSVATDGSRAAYRIYTSGSTGRPKGIEISQRAMVELAAWQRDYFRLDVGDVVSQLSTPSFDAIIGECCMALLSGATLAVVEDAQRTPEAFTRFLVQQRVSVAVVVPSFLLGMSAEAVPPEAERWLVVVGEAFAPSLAAAWLPRRRVVNAYGPAEFTVYATAHEVSLSRLDGLVPIGRARSRSRAYVLGEDLSPTPFGIPGELYLAGDGVALGYVNSPSATAAQFLPDQYAALASPPVDLVVPEAVEAIEAFALEHRMQALPRLVPPNPFTSGDVKQLCEGLDPELTARTLEIWATLDSDEARHGFARYLMEGARGLVRASGLGPTVLERLFEGPLLGRRGVDLGCGGAEVLDSLRELGADTIGVDLCPWLVNRARQRGHRVTYASIDSPLPVLADALGISVGSLDFSLATLVLDRVTSPTRLLENLLGLLRPGGRFALQVLLPNVPYDANAANAYTSPAERITPDADPATQLEAIVRRLGALGAADLATYRIPYAIVTSEGVERMLLWSIVGTASGRAGGQRMYRTGDRVVLRPDGELLFLGRIDRQLKVRGARLDPGEVERVLEQHPCVARAVVGLRSIAQDAPPILVAWCVCADATPIHDRDAIAERICEHATRYLAHWAIPQRIEFVAALPLGPSGKPDESLLGLSERKVPAALAPPRTPIESQLLEACQRVLGQGLGGIDDSLFDAGADSIALVRISSHLQHAGLRLEMQDYFECRTVRSLAARVTPLRTPLPASGTASPSPIQLWALGEQQLAPSWLVQWCVVALADAVNVSRLGRALEQVVERHDALRTSIRRGQIQVQSAAKAFVPLQFAADREAALALATCAIDPAGARMLAAVVISETRELVLVASHFAIDAVSWGILANDLAVAYRGEMLRFPAATHLDAVRGLQARARDEEAVAEAAYWLEQIDGCDVAAMPAPVESMASMRLDNDMSRALSAAARRLSTSPHVLLHAAVSRMLARASGKRRVCIDVESNGRALPGYDLSRTIGWFTALYPVSVEVDPALDCVEHVRASIEAFASVPGSGLQFRLLAAHLDDHDQRSRLADWRAPVVLNYLGRIGTVAQGEGLVREVLAFGGASPPHDHAAPYPVAIDAWMGLDDCLEIHAQCTGQSPLGSASTVTAGFAGELETLLRAIAGELSFNLGPVSTEISLERIRAVAAGHDITDVLPLNTMQAGMLFHVRAAPGSAVYENQMRFRLRGSFDPVRWSDAWSNLVTRHPVFRSAFVPAAAAWLRLVHGKVPVTTDVRDLRDATPSAQVEADALAAKERQRSFDLARPPLARMLLLRLEDASWEIVWTFHHLIIDGWSVAVLIEEMLHLYADPGLAVARSVPILDLPSSRPPSAAARAYWTRTLGAQASDPLALGPVGNPGDLSSVHGEASLLLGADESNQIAQMAQMAGVTLACYVQAAWALVLSRHSRTSDVTFGLTVSGREGLAQADDAAGLFVTTVPIRIQLSGDAHPATFLRDVQRMAIERHPYESVPLQEIQRWTGIPSPESPFNHVLLIENFPIDRARDAMPPELVLEDLHCRQRSHYPATLVVVPAEQLRLELSWELGRMSDSMADAVLEGMRRALEMLGSDVHDRLDDIEIDANRLSGHASTAVVAARAPGYRDTTIHACFEARAARDPDATALIDGPRRLSYGQLDAWANRLAVALLARGIAPEDRIGLLASRSIEAIVGMLAVLKAGAAWVPLDPTYPAQRVAQMIEASQPMLLLCNGDIGPDLSATAAGHEVLQLGDYATGPAMPSPSVAVHPDGLAYVLFTSGSTGIPKGVMGTHRSTLAVAAWREEAFPYAPDDRCLHKTPLGFGDSIQEILGPLLAGASLAILSPEGLRDPHRFVQEMLAHEVTRLIIVPSLLTAILASSAQVERLAKARLWIASGEALPVETVRAFKARLPEMRLINLYGASEAACDDTWAEVFDSNQAPLIGLPVSGASIHLLDERMRAVADGVLGEIHVGGEVVNRGYLNDPRQTASSFVPDPYTIGGRLFRTRDMGRDVPGEGYGYHGRADQQVSLRGIRIELAEVEAALAACSGVADAAVFHDDVARALVACVVPDERESLLRGGAFRVSPDGLALFDYRRSETDYLLVEASEGHTPMPILPDGAMVIDVGANIGMFSLAAHYAARDVRIVSIEPAPAIASVLRRNLLLHGCTFDLLPVAVGARAGAAQFTFYPEASLESGLHADALRDELIFRAAVDAGMHPRNMERFVANRFAGEVHLVEVVTLSDVMDRFVGERIDLVKIDVERAELEVLKGLRAEDFERIDRFIIEVEDTGGARDAIEMLLPSDFVRTWTPHGRLQQVGMWMLDAVRQSDGAEPKAIPRAPTLPRSALSERSLRAQLANVLPAYMLPSRIHILDELPRTPSGKLDRRALATMPQPQLVPSRHMDERERLISEVWMAALHHDRIGLDDNFFDVGGHSLLVLEVLDRLEAKGITGLSVPDFYTHPTISMLAGWLHENANGDEAAAQRGRARGERRRQRARVRSKETYV